VVAALAQKVQDGSLVVVDKLAVGESRTKSAADLLKRLGAEGKALLIDVEPDETLGMALRNIPGVQFLASARVGARDLMNASRVIATRAAVEKLGAL
jgi:large subunit ribosomal protein L4